LSESPAELIEYLLLLPLLDSGPFSNKLRESCPKVQEMAVCVGRTGSDSCWMNFINREIGNHARPIHKGMMIKRTTGRNHRAMII